MRHAMSLLLVLAFASEASARDCYWTSERGDTLDLVHLPDYNYAFQQYDGWGTLCSVMRSDVATTLACDNGLEAELEGFGEAVRIDGVLFTQQCVGEDELQQSEALRFGFQAGVTLN